MWLRKMHRLMQEAGEGGEGGGGGGGAAEGADTAASSADAAATSSALAAGATAPEAAPTEYIPEKYQVKNEAGEIDVEASARKLAEAHSHLEKKMGSGDAPPKTADDYAITAPDEFKDVDFKADPEIKDFMGRAHAAGLNQAQMDLVMSEYFKLAPMIANGAAILDTQGATEQLKSVWATDSEFKRNTHLAYSATAAAVERSGLSMEEVEASGLGNNPVFLRLMAGLGAEFQEDNAPGGTIHKTFGEDEVQKLELSEAYSNPKHPDHEKVSKQVRSWYERKYGTEAVA